MCAGALSQSVGGFHQQRIQALLTVGTQEANELESRPRPDSGYVPLGKSLNITPSQFLQCKMGRVPPLLPALRA